MRKFLGLSAILALLILANTGCKKGRSKVDLSGIPDNLQIVRFEQMLFAADTGRIAEADAQFSAALPEFYPVYTERMMGFGTPGSPESLQMMAKFITHPSLLDLKRTCDSVFGENPKELKEIREAFRYFRYYFPKQPIPTVVTMLSEFGFATAFMDSTLALGLDMYLGRNYKYYRGVGFPDYMIKNMEPPYLVPQAMMAWGRACFEQEKAGQRFLDKMINEGKMWYMTGLILPETHDSLITGLSVAQLKWCNDNQYQMWTHFIEQKLLFETDHTLYSAYLKESPFTIAPGVPPESAPMIGKYAGWQIVQRYMKKNPGVTLQQLMENQNADEILSLSGYRP